MNGKAPGACLLLSGQAREDRLLFDDVERVGLDLGEARAQVGSHEVLCAIQIHPEELPGGGLRREAVVRAALLRLRPPLDLQLLRDAHTRTTFSFLEMKDK